MDMLEWNIQLTSDQCEHRVYIETYEGKRRRKTGGEKIIEQCNHPFNETMSCEKENCPILIKEKDSI